MLWLLELSELDWLAISELHCASESTRALEQNPWSNCVSPTSSFSCKSKLFSYEQFCTKTRFETEAQGNLKMAYYEARITNDGEEGE